MNQNLDKVTSVRRVILGIALSLACAMTQFGFAQADKSSPTENLPSAPKPQMAAGQMTGGVSSLNQLALTAALQSESQNTSSPNSPRYSANTPERRL